MTSVQPLLNIAILGYSVRPESTELEKEFVSRISICMISEEHPPVGGVGTYVWNLSRALSELGCEVRLVTVNRQNSLTIQKETLHEYRIDRFDVPVLRTLDFGRKARIEIKKLCRENAVDIIHSNIPLFLDCAVALENSGRLPIVTTVHSLYKHRMESLFVNPLAPFLARFERMCMRKADMLIAVCKAMAAEIENYGISADKIGMIYNGIDAKEFNPNTSSETVFEKYDIQSDDRMLLYVGRLGDKRKGLPFLFQSLQVLQKKERVKLLVVGGGNIEQARMLAERFEVEDHVAFAGYVEHGEMPSIYAASDIFVLPSVSEGLPFTLLEALCMGKPVVASNIPGVDEVIQDGENGIMVEPKSPSAITDGVMNLLRDEDLAERLGANGRRTVLEDFTIENMSRRTYNLFSEIIAH